MYKYLGIKNCIGFRYRTVLPAGEIILSWQGEAYLILQRFFSKISGIGRDNHTGFFVVLCTQIVISNKRYNGFFIFFSDGKVTISTEYEEKNW